MDGRRTVQLRRYRLEAGHLDAFLAWFGARIVPARQAFGFRIEWAYAVPGTEEFVWAVSVPGDEASFRTLDEAWIASPERAAAFAGEPRHVASSDLRIADRIV